MTPQQAYAPILFTTSEERIIRAVRRGTDYDAEMYDFHMDCVGADHWIGHLRVTTKIQVNDRRLKRRVLQHTKILIMKTIMNNRRV
jgi:hypothetical protein